MKKIFILLMLIAPMSMFAQQKFGYVNSAEIIQVMPEYAKALKDVQALEKMYTDEFNSMRTELEKKGTEFEKMQQDSVPESILKRRYEELMQMQERLQTYGQEVQMNLQKKEQEKLLRKLRKAVESIEAELADIERQIAEYDARFATATEYRSDDYAAYNALKERYDRQMHEWEKASYELEITEAQS